MAYSRVLLKLSGETLSDKGIGISSAALERVAQEIKAAKLKTAELAVVVGAGNLWRGAGKEIERVTADYMGMLATIMNSLALRDTFQKNGMPAVVQSALSVSKFAELYRPEKAIDYLQHQHIVILAGGTGNPYFTTDTTAALRAVELKAEVILKATQVDGVYDDDPRRNPGAKKYDQLTFDEALQKKLGIMDLAAFSLCRENRMPVIVFDFHRPGNLAKVLAGENIGTRVTP